MRMILALTGATLQRCLRTGKRSSSSCCASAASGRRADGCWSWTPSPSVRDDATAQQIHERLRAGGEAIGLATVYRALALLSEHGVVDVLAHHPGESCYRLCGVGHHHHLVCTSCHRVVELRDCSLDDWLSDVAAAHGFALTGHEVEVSGVCSQCRAA